MCRNSEALDNNLYLKSSRLDNISLLLIILVGTNESPLERITISDLSSLAGSRMTTVG